MEWEHLVRRFVRANGGLCIPRARLRLAPVLLASAQDCRLRDRLVPAHARVRQLAGLASAMFRAV